MCCLKYEEAAYEDALKSLPAIGSSIETPDGRGNVTEVNAISRMVKVCLDRRPDAAPQSFQYGPQGAQRKPPSPLEAAAPAPAAEAPQQEARPPESRKPEPRREKRPAPPLKQPRAESGEAGRPAGGERPAPGPAAPGGERPAGGKSWRERHPQRKLDTPPPAYRQEPVPRRAAPPNPPPQPRKTPPPVEKEKPVPRYGEIAAPRRANAQQPPRPQQQGGPNYRRQPWQKKDGQKDKGNKGQGE
jgi:hypothetical protein